MELKSNMYTLEIDQDLGGWWVGGLQELQAKALEASVMEYEGYEEQIFIPNMVIESILSLCPQCGSSTKECKCSKEE